MNLLKASALSGIASIVRIVTGIIVTKVIAVLVGPTGLAVIGQLQNLVNLTMLITGNFLQTAVTRYTAKYSDEPEEKYQIWSASIKIIIILNAVLFFAFLFYSEEISIYFLQTAEYSYILRIFSIALPFFVLNTLLLSILNGQREIKKYIYINILLSLLSLVIVCVLTYFYGLEGALIAYVTNQSAVFVITFILLYKEPWLKIKNFFYKNSIEDYKKLFSFAIITFVSITVSNVSIIYIRSYLIENISQQAAGNWQAMWSLSQISISLLTASLTTYLLPKLAQLKGKDLINEELLAAFKILLPSALFISVIMYFARDLIISLLYTPEFSSIRDLFFWQLLGSCVKVCGWLFAYVLVAKGLVKYTISIEIFNSLIWCVTTSLFVDIYGLIGAIYAFVLSALIHVISVFLLYKYKV